jgi:hypothetical protein
MMAPSSSRPGGPGVPQYQGGPLLIQTSLPPSTPAAVGQHTQQLVYAQSSSQPPMTSVYAAQNQPIAGSSPYPPSSGVPAPVTGVPAPVSIHI